MMVRSLFSRVFLLAPLSLFSAPSLLAADAVYEPSNYLLSNVKEGSQRERYLANLLESFAAIDTDGDGIAQDDIDRFEASKAEEASRRLQRRIDSKMREFASLDTNGDDGVSAEEMLAAMVPPAPNFAADTQLFARLDSDGDGELSREELRRSGRGWDEASFAKIDANGNGRLSLKEMTSQADQDYQTRRQKAAEQISEGFSRADLDGNGIITIDEMTASIPRPRLKSREQTERRRLFARLISLDPNSDGKLTAGEITERFNQQYLLIDTDQDDVISAAEARKARPLLRMAREFAKTPICKLPDITDRSEPIALLATEGERVSTMALGTQTKATSLIDVDVEEGERPLFLVLGSREPVIWAFSGAVERLERVVLLAKQADEQGNALVATTGLSDQQIVFGEAGCLPTDKILSLGSADYRKMAPLFAASTGLQADIQRTSGSMVSVQLPSLTTDRSEASVPAPEGFDPPLWAQALRSYSHGFGEPDLDTLVTQTSVERYEILPKEYGLAQLAARGVIEETQHLFEYRIIRQLDTFPEALQTGRRLNFVLGEGISRPDGEIGSSCIFASDGTTVLEGDYCAQHLKRRAVQVRANDRGGTCLERISSEKVGCFPEDGRPLRVVETETGVKFEPAETRDAPPEAMQTMPAMPTTYEPSIDIIPAGLRQRW